MVDRLLILSASAGAGHVRAAQALEKAALELRVAGQVRHLDCLQFTSRLFRGIFSDAYLRAINSAPGFLGWLYDYMDKPWRRKPFQEVLTRFNTRRFARVLAESNPSLAVCTHFLPAEVLARVRGKGRLRCPYALVVTDLDAHAFWLMRDCDHYFVALEETRIHLEKLGIAPARVSVTGIPIDPVFAENKDAAAMRDKHGLRQGLATILVATGGFGVGPIEQLLTCLSEVRQPAQVVVICGRNAALKTRLETWRAKLPAAAPPLHLVGFTTKMDEYMAAADILLGKPGGLTMSEALAKGLAYVIVNPVPGQEERNSDHLLEQGIAIRCNNLPALGAKVDGLLADAGRLAAMKQAARRLARPDAARAVVRKLMDLTPAD